MIIQFAGQARWLRLPSLSDCKNFCGKLGLPSGDAAAMSFDPLSGRGLCKALETGQLAARTITGDGVMGLAAYARWSEELWVSFVKLNVGSTIRWKEDGTTNLFGTKWWLPR